LSQSSLVLAYPLHTDIITLTALYPLYYSYSLSISLHCAYFLNCYSLHTRLEYCILCYDYSIYDISISPTRILVRANFDQSFHTLSKSTFRGPSTSSPRPRQPRCYLHHPLCLCTRSISTTMTNVDYPSEPTVDRNT
jgi:hypothetical protein